MTIIKSSEFPYLNEDIIEKYNNVIIISAEGLMMKMNALMLSAMSHSLKMALLEFDDFHGDHMITTEFSLEELKQLKNYCNKGMSDAMTESIMNSFGLLRPLSVCLNRQEKWNQKNMLESKPNITNSSMIKTENLLESQPIITNSSMIKTEIPMENEFIDIKEELLEDVDFDYNLEYASDDSFHPPPIKEKNRQKRKKPIIKDYNEQSKDLEFNVGLEYSSDDSLPLKRKKNKVRKKLTKRQKTNIKGEDIGWKPKIPRKIGRPGPWSDKEFELFKSFELPKPLQEYVSKQKKFDQRKFDESMMGENKHFQCSLCQMKFTNSWNLNIHEIKFHNEHYQCPSCDAAKKVEDAEEFKKHVFEHLGMDYVQVKCSYLRSK